MNIYDYLGKNFECEFCGRIHYLPIKAIKTGLLEDLNSFVLSLISKGSNILLLTDNIVWEVMGKRVKDIMEVSFSVAPHILYPSEEKRVTARDEYMGGILNSAGKSDAIITAGTGTITDLGKYAADILNKPVICLPSAPSMNAYTSGVAALIKGGVKLTFPVNPAAGVFADEQILIESPLELIKAGFADSCAKAFANADWKISSILTGEHFCSLPLKIVNKAEKRYIERGNLLSCKDRETISALMEGLNLGGISMIIAGSSSPASGGEHLISHFLDMYAHQNQREPFAYHGLQVGTGIYISAFIYEHLSNLSTSDIKRMLKPDRIDYEEKLQHLKSLFPLSADIIEEELKKKVEIDSQISKTLPERWDEIKSDVFPIVYKSEEIKKFLNKAGCPVSLKDIEVDKKLAIKAITLCRFIRRRPVILDIADLLGVLDEIAEIQSAM